MRACYNCESNELEVEERDGGSIIICRNCGKRIVRKNTSVW